jgi:cell division protein FtsB
MSPRPDRAAATVPPTGAPDDVSRASDAARDEAEGLQEAPFTRSLADLPVAGLTRRRVGYLLGALIAAWIVVLFARQLGDASAAATRAEDLQAANVALADDVRALERELELIRRQAYVAQQARAYRLGGDREVPFTLGPEAPPLAADAPGMAGVRLGAEDMRRTPLESWLELLFGPGR